MVIVESVESDISIMLSDFDASFILKGFEQMINSYNISKNSYIISKNEPYSMQNIIENFTFFFLFFIRFIFIYFHFSYLDQRDSAIKLACSSNSDDVSDILHLG